MTDDPPPAPPLRRRPRFPGILPTESTTMNFDTVELKERLQDLKKRLLTLRDHL